MPSVTNNYESLSKEDLVRLLVERDLDTETNPHRKKYGLIWEEKPENFEADSIGRIPVLKRGPEKCIQVDASKPTHVLIQGDNYHALKVLTYTHERSIDVIYIDPPYNTGNKDFKYNDDYVDREDGYRHSKWLSFMAKRLRLAQRLLSERGVVFISIDDNELAQLKLLCDEIFGERSFHGIVTWEKKTKPVNMGKARFGLQARVEYVLVYTRATAEAHKGFTLSKAAAREYPLKDETGAYRLEEIVQRKNTGRMQRDTMVYPVLGEMPKDGYRWQLSQERYASLLQANSIRRVKGRVFEVIRPDQEDPHAYEPFWSHSADCGTAESAKALLSDIIGEGHGFETVKPLGLIEFLLSKTPSDAVVLDFFAGSGTTAHAVLRLNEQGARRQCIVVTNDEGEYRSPAGARVNGGICTHVTYPRLSNVIRGYRSRQGDQVPGLGENLEFFTTDFIVDRAIERHRRELSARSAEMLCLSESCFIEEESVDKRWRSFTNNRGKRLVVVSDAYAAEDLRPVLKADKRATVLYAFRFDEDDDPQREYGGRGLEHITAKPIPDGLLTLYRRLAKQE